MEIQFRGIKRKLSYTQLNAGSIQEVFPLLCPVREKDWLAGWTYQMIYSSSGFIEKDCVFTTPHHGEFDTVWQVTLYDAINYSIEFIRHTPGENIVKINIQLEPINKGNTKVIINYQFTALSEEQNRFIENDLEESFLDAMRWWEKSINYYLKTGRMLRKI